MLKSSGEVAAFLWHCHVAQVLPELQNKSLEHGSLEESPVLVCLIKPIVIPYVVRY